MFHDLHRSSIPHFPQCFAIFCSISYSIIFPFFFLSRAQSTRFFLCGARAQSSRPAGHARLEKSKTRGLSLFFSKFIIFNFSHHFHHVSIIFMIFHQFSSCVYHFLLVVQIHIFIIFHFPILFIIVLSSPSFPIMIIIIIIVPSHFFNHLCKSVVVLNDLITYCPCPPLTRPYNHQLGVGWGRNARRQSALRSAAFTAPPTPTRQGRSVLRFSSP